MTEKFARNGAVPAELDVAKRTYYLAEGRIRTLYHYPDGDVTRVCKVPRHVFQHIYYMLPGGNECFVRGDALRLNKHVNTTLLQLACSTEAKSVHMNEAFPRRPCVTNRVCFASVSQSCLQPRYRDSCRFHHPEKRQRMHSIPKLHA